MHLPTLLIPTLFFLAHALPQPPTTTPESPQTTSPEMTLQVSELQAWTTIASPGSDKNNSAAFLVHDPGYTYGAVCSVSSNKTLYSTATWYPCEMRRNATGTRVAFQISDGFNDIGLMKGWMSNGTYLTGFATWGTHWKEGENVTTTTEGKFYERMEPMELEITRIVA